MMHLTSTREGRHVEVVWTARCRCLYDFDRQRSQMGPSSVPTPGAAGQKDLIVSTNINSLPVLCPTSEPSA